MVLYTLQAVESIIRVNYSAIIIVAHILIYSPCAGAAIIQNVMSRCISAIKAYYAMSSRIPYSVNSKLI